MSAHEKSQWNAFFEMGLSKASKISASEIEAQIRQNENSPNLETRAYVDGLRSTQMASAF